MKFLSRLLSSTLPATAEDCILRKHKVALSNAYKGTLYVSGVTVTPVLPRRLGKGWSLGSSKWKTWRMDDNKRSSSMRASTSPRHILLPV